MRVPRVALHTNYYDNNFGDLLLLKVFERWVLEAAECEVVFPDVPEREHQRFAGHFPGFTPSTGPRWDALIYSGGGLFADTGKDGRWLLGHFARRFFREVAKPGNASRLRRVPYAILGPGAGPLSNNFVRIQAKALFNGAKVVSIRDSQSRDFLTEDLGVRRTVHQAPDPATTISLEDVPSTATALIKERLRPFEGRFLLGIHHPRDFVQPTAHSTAALRALVRVLKRRPEVAPILFTDIGSDGGIHWCTSLAAELTRAGLAEPTTIPFPGVWETVALIGSLSAVVTTKLHVGVVAFATGTYAESFANHPKTPQFYGVTERPDQAILFEHITEDEATRRFERAIGDGDPGRRFQGSAWHRVRQEAGLHRRLTHQFLSEALPAARKVIHVREHAPASAG